MTPRVCSRGRTVTSIYSMMIPDFAAMKNYATPMTACVKRCVSVEYGDPALDAEQRVIATIAHAKAAATEAKAAARQAADLARKAAAKLSLWTFVSLLAGAFCASYAATVGGRQRDHVKL